MYRRFIKSIPLLLFMAFTMSACGKTDHTADIQVNTEAMAEASDSTETMTDLPDNAGNITEAPDSAENIIINVPEEPAMNDRVTYQPGFYYESLSDSIKNRITGISYPEDCTIPYEDLRYVSVLHYDSEGTEKTGELVCNQAIAQDLVEIFYELYQANYPIERIKLIDDYDGEDEFSMKDNNSSCFNYRVVAGTTHLSKHALGMAVDINPFYNPYVTHRDGNTRVDPEGSEPYADRTADFPFKITQEDLTYQLFTEHGFIWGGDWNSVKDYQHFEKELPNM